MADEGKQKKSIFDRAIDALTGRDEKAAAAEAARKAEEAKVQAAEQARQKAAADAAAHKQADDLARMAAAEAAARKTAADKADAEKRVADAEAKMREVQQAEQQRLQAEQQRQQAEQQRQQQAQMDEERRKYAEVQAALEEKAKPKFIGEHRVVSGDTLSQIAQNFYGHAARDYWMVIYEANKAAIGDNPGMIHPGTVLQIPELPESLKG